MGKPTETEIAELAASFINGNISYVAQEIAAMAPGHAAYVTGAMVMNYLNRPHAESLMRAIGRRIED